MAFESWSFNPYRVFKFVATCGEWFSYTDRMRVSIPIGFSSSLQHYWNHIGRCQMTCFNPYRVFKFVATHIRIASRKQVVNVSIPIGFSSSLQRKRAPRRNTSMMPFQSLSGFQVRCNQATMVGSLPSLLGFNPYRVFKFVATQGIIW